MTPERFARFDQALSTESHRPHNTGARKESNEERRPWPRKEPGRETRAIWRSADHHDPETSGGCYRSSIERPLAKRRRREARRWLGERPGMNRKQFDELVKDQQNHRLQSRHQVKRQATIFVSARADHRQVDDNSRCDSQLAKVWSSLGRRSSPDRQAMAGRRAHAVRLASGRPGPGSKPPTAAMRGPKYVVRTGETPALGALEARQILDSIDTSTVVGLRHRALIGLLVFTFARIGAALGMTVADVFWQHRRLWVRLHEKGGKEQAMPCHHNLETYLPTTSRPPASPATARAWFLGSEASREAKSVALSTHTDRFSRLSIQPTNISVAST
jgi:integrase